MMRVLVATVAALALGTVIGHALPPKAPASEPSAGIPTVTRCAVAIGRDEVDAIAAAVARAVGGRPEIASAEPPAPAAPADPTAAATGGRGAEIVDRALAAGTWTEDDRMKLRLVLPDLPDAERRDALTSLFRAVNEGRLSLNGPPF